MRKGVYMMLVLLCCQACGRMDAEEKHQYQPQLITDTVIVNNINVTNEATSIQGVVVGSHVKLRSQPDLSSSTVTFLTIDDTLFVSDSVVVQSCQWAVLKGSSIVTKYYGNDLLDKNQAVRILSENNGYSQIEIDSSGYRVKGEILTSSLNKQAFQTWYKVRSSRYTGWVYKDLIRIL